VCTRLQVVTVVAGKVTVLLHMMQCKFTHVHAVSNFIGEKKNPSILNICSKLDIALHVTFWMNFIKYNIENKIYSWHTDKLTLHLNKVAHKLCLNLFGNCATQHVTLWCWQLTTVNMQYYAKKTERPLKLLPITCKVSGSHSNPTCLQSTLGT
jgi:hypothetical protein